LQLNAHVLSSVTNEQSLLLLQLVGMPPWSNSSRKTWYSI